MLKIVKITLGIYIQEDLLICIWSKGTGDAGDVNETQVKYIKTNLSPVLVYNLKEAALDRHLTVRHGEIINYPNNQQKSQILEILRFF